MAKYSLLTTTSKRLTIRCKRWLTVGKVCLASHRHLQLLSYRRNGSEINTPTNGGRRRRREAFVKSVPSSLIVEYLTRSQGINYGNSLGNGNLHRIHPQITTSRVIVNMREPRSGSLKATNSKTGR